MTDTIVRFEEMSKSFKGIPLFRDASFDIEAGQSYGLTGPNGSGKSVLLQMMCGLIRPDTGRATIAPRYLSKGRTFPDWFGISINGPAFLAGLSAIENLRSLAAIRGRADDDELKETLSEVGLDPNSSQRVRSFSLGMKQKLSLAQAFIESPKVLLLDEPFNALDEASVMRVGALLRMRQAEGVTLVLTSHHPQEISDYCDTRLSIQHQSVMSAAGK